MNAMAGIMKAGAKTDVVSSITLPQCLGVPSVRNMRDGFAARIMRVLTANMMSASCHLLNTIEIIHCYTVTSSKENIYCTILDDKAQHSDHIGGVVDQYGCSYNDPLL